MKKLMSILFSRLFIICSLILIQVIILVMLIWKLSNYFVYVYGSFSLLSLIIILWLISKNDNPSIKLPWVILILILPVFGGLFYLIFGLSHVSKKAQDLADKLSDASCILHDGNNIVIDEVKEIDPHISGQMQYLKNVCAMPPYKNTETTYLCPGEVKFEHMKEELKKAKHFIFLEYFIIQEGKMWNGLLEILVAKAAEGLDVRVMYDDIGCVNTLPYKYNEKLESLGIKCTIFNPFRPSLNIIANNRDHRKITVIDGIVGFNGGINLADEYINEFEKHGHWKDSAIMLKGEAVWNLTLMFLQSWNFYNFTDLDFSKFKPHTFNNVNFETDGYVQPYMDSPLDNELVGESVYLNIINNACEYIYINTPYFIVDNELVTSLVLASKRGVDVRIVTPHVADKWYVHLITQAYYPILINAGIKVYEYTPGFIHSKTYLADDEIGVIGTINMDYRSLYHHFECATLLYKTKSLDAMKQDFVKTLEICTLITEEDCRNVKWYKRCIRGLIRIFAPLM